MSTRNLNMDVYSSFSHNCQNLEAIRLTLTSLNTFALRSFIFFYATRLPLTLNFSLLTVKTDLLSAYSVMDFSTPDIPHDLRGLLMVALRGQGNWRWEGPLGTPLGLVHWKRASSPVEAGTAGYL